MAAAITSPLSVARPPLPYGRRLHLPGRGTTFIREVQGPRNAPTILLLHGWCASAGLNWRHEFEPLARHFNVIAPDLRGHARGLRTRKIFRLADCADDCAATLEQLGTGPVIVAGYSMGGPISQLLWRRHRDLVDGMVLSATTMGFMPKRVVRRAYQAWMFGAAAGARALSVTPLLPGLPALNMATKSMPAWAAAEVRRHDWRMIVEAGQSISTYYAGRWIGEVDVPTSVVVTEADHGVPADLQLATAEAIPGATVHRVDEGHLACAKESFAEPFVGACLDVLSRVNR